MNHLFSVGCLKMTRQLHWHPHYEPSVTLRSKSLGTQQLHPTYQISAAIRSQAGGSFVHVWQEIETFIQKASRLQDQCFPLQTQTYKSSGAQLVCVGVFRKTEDEVIPRWKKKSAVELRKRQRVCNFSRHALQCKWLVSGHQVIRSSGLDS